jgi:ABC-type sugar transport system substrate-binding protein
MSGKDLGTDAMNRRTLLRRGATAGIAIPMSGGLLAACGSSSSTSSGGGAQESKKTHRLANFFDSLADQWFVDETRGAKEAAAALGIASTQDFTFEDDPSNQVQQFQNAGTRKLDLWACYGPLGATVPQLAAQAKRANAIACQEFDLKPWTHPLSYGPNLRFYWLPDNEGGAYLAGKKVLEEIGGKGNVVVMAAFPGGGNDTGVKVGYERALDEFPDVKVLARGVGKFQQEPAQKLMADWLAAYPKIDAVLSYVDTQSFGIYAAMKQAGRTNIPIASVNGQLPGLEAVKSGQITVTVFSNPWYFGGWRTVRLHDLANGYKADPLESMVALGSSLVDKSNVDKYIEYAKAPKVPIDWTKVSRLEHPNDWENQAVVKPLDPVAFWKTHGLGAKEPADWLPTQVKQSLDAGGLDKLAGLYEEHTGTPVPA